MRTCPVRPVVLTVILALLMTAIAPFLAVSGDDKSMTRSQTGFIAKDDFYLHTEYNLEDLYVVVWMENTETFYRQVPGRDNFFKFREIANAFTIPVDGSSHSSGNVKRTLVELFTATDCGYCPGAEGALHTLTEERFPDDFSLIEWHSAINPGNDQYEVPSSRARFSTYNVTGRPTVIFDGLTAQIGGDQNPTNTQLPRDYGKKIDAGNLEEPMVSFSGSADTSGTYLSYNISFNVINPMTKGTWALRAMVVEDLKSDHLGATMRFVPRGSMQSKTLPDLQEGYPDITLDEDGTFQDQNSEKVKGNLTIMWNASDPEDGNDVTVDVLYRESGTEWGVLMMDAANTGSYVWNTAEPRIPDGTYEIRLITEDTEGNRILSHEASRFTINNPDVPLGNFTYPTGFKTFTDAQEIRWTSEDDEDDPMDMEVRISISNDTGSTFKRISYNIVTGDFWITNMGTFDLNTLNYEDIDTYMLKIELKDTDGMITTILSDIFEVYNNDEPRATLLSPAQDSTVTSLLDIGWRVTDPEDLPSAITGNFSVRMADGDKWNILFLGLLDDGMANKTFETSLLSGDGDYILRFTVEDSRGGTHSVSREFTVYDPDAPELSTVTSTVTNPDDIRSGSIRINWDGSDPDDGETITYSVFISQSTKDNWTLVAGDIDSTTYTVDLTSFEEGSYKLRVVAKDSSADGLTDMEYYGPFFYNKPDEPNISLFTSSADLDEGIPEDINSTINDGEYFLDLSWSASDDDDDNLTYRLQYRKGEGDWTDIVVDYSGSSYSFNMTSLPSGQYSLRIVAADDSDSSLESEMILGPFLWDNVILNPPGDDDDDDSDPVEEEDTSDEPDWTLYIIIAVASVIVVIVIVLIALFAASKLGKKGDSTEVIPDEKDMDYTQIPEFERQAPRKVVQGYYQQEPAAPQIPEPQIQPIQEPVPIVQDQVNMEATENTQVGRGSDPVYEPPAADETPEDRPAEETTPIPEFKAPPLPPE